MAAWTEEEDDDDVEVATEGAMTEDLVLLPEQAESETLTACSPKQEAKSLMISLIRERQ